MTPIPADQLLGQLRWRYAVKAFDPHREIPSATWDVLEEALVLTPSSFGLQPWRFVVVTDRALRERLVAHAWGQRQVADCSHFVVLCRQTILGEAQIDRYLQRVHELRGTPMEKLAGLRRILADFLTVRSTPGAIEEWATRQVYIALGNFMTAAALLGVDSCPMEGFDAEQFDALLGLRERGLASVVCCAAGYRSLDDRYAAMAKVRFPRSELVEHLPPAREASETAPA